MLTTYQVLHSTSEHTAEFFVNHFQTSFFWCFVEHLFFIPLLLARSPATTTAAVVQCLTTDSPVTQLNFHSIRLCMLHAPIYTLCVSFLIPHHPVGSVLRCIENSVEQHPRVLQYLHWRQDFRRQKIQARHHSCHWTKHNRRETLCMLLLLFLRANKTSCSTDVVRTQMFFVFFQHV